MIRLIFMVFTHGVALGVGGALGIYLLPILTAPKGPSTAVLDAESAGALYTAQFMRGQPGNDFLHWGEGKISISADQIVHQGELAPGPDYKLYLLDRFVEDEAGFLAVKDTAKVVGDVKSFKGFVMSVPDGVDVEKYTTVLIWCESFSEFITSAQYR